MVTDGLPKAEILSQGEELLHGDIADTNAAWLSQCLVRLGFDVVRHTAVGDRLDDLMNLLREIAGRSSLCLSTGGLGPTCDDLTAEAFAQAFGRPLKLDTVALAQIEHRYQRLGRAMPASNRRQALLPEGTERLDNHWGTAPGFWATQGGCRLGFLPGVPEEMRQIFKHSIEPRLRQGFRLRPEILVTLRTMGLGESNLQEITDRLALPKDVRVGFRASSPVVDVKLQFPLGYEDDPLTMLADAVHDAIGSAVVARWRSPEQAPDPIESLGQLLRTGGSTLAALECVSGGEIGRRCLGRSWFLESRVATLERLACRAGWDAAPFANDRKGREALAGLLDRERKQVGVDYLIAQFDSDDRHDLTVAISGAGATAWAEVKLIAVGERRQRAAAEWSLEILRRHLMGLPVQGAMEHRR